MFDGLLASSAAVGPAPKLWRPKSLASAAQGESSSAAVVVFLATAAVLQVVLAAGCTFLAGFCAATGAVIVVPLVVAAASSETDAMGCLTGASDCRTTENCSLCQTNATAASPVLGCVRPKCPHASASFLLSRPAGFVAEILA